MFTYYDFTWPDESMVDFMVASGNGTRTAIPNFSTPPQWLYNTDRVIYPDDPLECFWNYESSNEVVDKTYKTFGDYYGRLVAYYAEGGFNDEYGRFIPGYYFNISIWEVLNEVEGEHHDNPAEYTAIYDAVVQGIQRFAPNAVKNNNMKFVGLALESDTDFSYATYFLNSSNHLPGVPVDIISFHFYASSSSRDGGVNASDYENFFVEAESFLQDAAQFMAIRDSSDYPNALIDGDELGVILPDDNDAKWTSDDPGFPLIYWNAAAALYAFEFGRLSEIGFDVVGMSQLVGYPTTNITRRDTGENYTLAPQFPSVAMLDWVTGSGTARYWVLKLFIDTLVPFSDQVINTTVSMAGVNGSNPFCGSIINNADLSLACVDPGSTINNILFASYGTPTGSTCGSYAVNNTCNAANSTSIVTSACLGKSSCTVSADTAVFGDPCYGTVKHLIVEATCTGPNGGYQPPAGGSPVYAQSYLGGGYKKVLLVNKSSQYHMVQLPLADFGNGGTWHVVDSNTGFSPARIDMIPTSGLVQLAPYAVGFAITSQ
jgi:Galactose binding lectin domain